jgi:hypothetical protein
LSRFLQGAILKQVSRGWRRDPECEPGNCGKNYPMICPHCGSKKVHRSRRRWYEYPMRLIGIRPYRCHQCCERFFTGKPKQRQDEPAPVRKEISLAHDLADAHRSTLRGAGARVGGGDEKQGFVPHGQVSCSRICDGSGTRTAVHNPNLSYTSDRRLRTLSPKHLSKLGNIPL